MSVEECSIIELPKIQDHRGNLSFIESGRHMPFEIKRVYYLYDLPGVLPALRMVTSRCSS